MLVDAFVPHQPPAPRRHDCPDRFNQTERPGSLKKSVGRTKRTRASESQDEPRTPTFQCVTDQHRGHGKQTKKCQAGHSLTRVIASLVTLSVIPQRNNLALSLAYEMSD